MASLNSRVRSVEIVLTLSIRGLQALRRYYVAESTRLYSLKPTQAVDNERNAVTSILDQIDQAIDELGEVIP